MKAELDDATGRRYVAGIGMIAQMIDGEPVSEINMRADRFAIGTPGANPVYPFLVMTVDGTQKVVISGAVIGEAVIDTANIRDLAINGRKIRDLSATNIAAAEGAGRTPITIECTGKPVVLWYFGHGWFSAPGLSGIPWRSDIRVKPSVVGNNTFGTYEEWQHELGWGPTRFDYTRIVAIELRK